MTTANAVPQFEIEPEALEVIELELTEDERRINIDRAEVIHWGSSTLVKLTQRHFEAIGTYSDPRPATDSVRTTLARGYALRRFGHRR